MAALDAAQGWTFLCSPALPVGPALHIIAGARGTIRGTAPEPPGSCGTCQRWSKLPPRPASPAPGAPPPPPTLPRPPASSAGSFAARTLRCGKRGAAACASMSAQGKHLHRMHHCAAVAAANAGQHRRCRRPHPRDRRPSSQSAGEVQPPHGAGPFQAQSACTQKRPATSPKAPCTVLTATSFLSASCGSSNDSTRCVSPGSPCLQ